MASSQTPLLKVPAGLGQVKKKQKEEKMVKHLPPCPAIPPPLGSARPSQAVGSRDGRKGALWAPSVGSNVWGWGWGPRPRCHQGVPKELGGQLVNQEARKILGLHKKNPKEQRGYGFGDPGTSLGLGGAEQLPSPQQRARWQQSCFNYS